MTRNFSQNNFKNNLSFVGNWNKYQNYSYTKYCVGAMFEIFVSHCPSQVLKQQRDSTRQSCYTTNELGYDLISRLVAFITTEAVCKLIYLFLFTSRLANKNLQCQQTLGLVVWSLRQDEKKTWREVLRLTTEEVCTWQRKSW